ncbi:hypothetical protein SCHPADRAFT_947185 [Schizopora paradoxa]|uniref:Uncharacterized protein n=1 Tax=Schizopora paradoxa TaxID=27342 RepID=A0A0H2RJX8_9AGAM|nr:hypothetical protein SCHPADRAFT_947185 [Schizopora paradoxa]
MARNARRFLSAELFALSQPVNILPAGLQANGERLETYWLDKGEDKVFKHTFVIGTGAPETFIEDIFAAKYGNLSETEYKAGYAEIQKKTSPFH